jgi:hypothetical protein
MSDHVYVLAKTPLKLGDFGREIPQTARLELIEDGELVTEESFYCSSSLSLLFEVPYEVTSCSTSASANSSGSLSFTDFKVSLPDGPNFTAFKTDRYPFQLEQNTSPCQHFFRILHDSIDIQFMIDVMHQYMSSEIALNSSTLDLIEDRLSQNLLDLNPEESSSVLSIPSETFFTEEGSSVVSEPFPTLDQFLAMPLRIESNASVFHIYDETKHILATNTGQITLDQSGIEMQSLICYFDDRVSVKLDKTILDYSFILEIIEVLCPEEQREGLAERDQKVAAFNVQRSAIQENGRLLCSFAEFSFTLNNNGNSLLLDKHTTIRWSTPERVLEFLVEMSAIEANRISKMTLRVVVFHCCRSSQMSGYC